MSMTTAEEPPPIRELRGALQGTTRALRSLAKLANHDYTPGSRAEHDNEVAGFTDGGERWARQAHATALMRLTAVEDGLGAIADLMWTDHGVYSPWVVGRFVLENAGLVSWMLDLEITTQQRIARALTDRVRSLQEVRKIEHDIGEAGETHSDRRLAHIETEAAKLGLAVHSDPKRGLWTIGNEHRPSRIDAVASLVGRQFGSVAYRGFTAASHGEIFGLMQGLTVADNPEAYGGAPVAQPTISVESVAVLSAIVLLGAFTAGDSAVAYFGWDHKTWTQWTSHALRTAKRWSAAQPPGESMTDS